MVVVALDSPAKTPLEALRVPRSVLQDTPVMESIVWVSQANDICNIYVCPLTPLHDSGFIFCANLPSVTQIVVALSEFCYEYELLTVCSSLSATQFAE